MCVIAYADERRRAARLGPTGPLLTLTGYHGQSQTEAGTPDRDTDLPEIKREEGAGGSGGCAGVGGGGRQWRWARSAQRLQRRRRWEGE